MAHIISMSLNEGILQDLNKVQKDMGFSGRSEALRAGLRMLLLDHREKRKLKGMVNATLIIMHDEHHGNESSHISHKHQDLIKTHIHNHLENHLCLEVFVLKGDSKEITAMADAYKTNRKITFCKLVVF